MNEQIQCDQCKNIATVECTWGLFEIRGEPRKEPMQNANLCSECSNVLWDRVKSGVNAGIMYWKNSIPISNTTATMSL